MLLLLFMSGCKKDLSVEAILDQMSISENAHYQATITMEAIIDEDKISYGTVTQYIDVYLEKEIIMTESVITGLEENAKYATYVYRDTSGYYLRSLSFDYDKEDKAFIEGAESFYVYDQNLNDYDTYIEELFPPRLHPNFSLTDMTLLDKSYTYEDKTYVIKVILNFETLCEVSPELSVLKVQNDVYFEYTITLNSDKEIAHVLLVATKAMEVEGGLVQNFRMSGRYILESHIYPTKEALENHVFKSLNDRRP